ncbi:hypothetical protein PRIPAC_85447 [Pristionchus pacificus]|uniref:Uncharacterized protein n=1 Tax=Pristionchus pacificus TaxID=54126 RepID=A0A2A6BL23_PRIPA|nr:hypothetical protein PRIPAC_85447 [Pristionchus pacificus]|eukprot:PDM66609.1 hypothetical protein PRIPAC_48026 [Pristionchus pacificus]
MGEISRGSAREAEGANKEPGNPEPDNGTRTSGVLGLLSGSHDVPLGPCPLSFRSRWVFEQCVVLGGSRTGAPWRRTHVASTLEPHAAARSSPSSIASSGCSRGVGASEDAGVAASGCASVVSAAAAAELLGALERHVGCQGPSVLT